MNDMSKRIIELRKEVDRLEREIRELESENSNYYIGVCYEEYDDDVVELYYHRLGFISEATAEKWAYKQQDEYEYVFNASYFEVTKEMYDKYYDWYCLHKLNEIINVGNTAINNLEGIFSFKEVLNKALINLTKEIGRDYSDHEYPGEDVRVYV